MNSIVISDRASDLMASGFMHQAGQAANEAAARNVFSDYTSRKAKNTLTRQHYDLACFADFLRAAGLNPGDLASDPEAWRGITWGLVEAFKGWMLQQGFAIGTINFRLSTVKVYAKMAAKAGAIEPATLAMMQAVEGYAHKEIKRIDEQRDQEGYFTRIGSKKAEAVSITRDQARQLKGQPNTPQGRRDAVIMAILLDHGLRCGEVALLKVEDIDLQAGRMTFYRPKVDKIQTHQLTRAALQALRDYLATDQKATAGPLLLASKKGGKHGEACGKLGAAGMTERAITKRAAFLGQLVGLAGLSAHDCRHYWATQAARNGTPLDRLQDAGGWSSLAMPARYIEAAAIANQGVLLGSD